MLVPRSILFYLFIIYVCLYFASSDTILCFFWYLCVDLLVCVFTHAHKCVHVVAGGWHCVFHCPLHLSLFWERAYHSIRTLQLAKMSGQWSPGICLSPVYARRSTKVTEARSFMWGQPSELRSLCSHRRHLSIEPSPSPASFFLMTGQNSVPSSVTSRSHILFSCHPANRHLGWFHILAIVNRWQ